MFLVSVIDCTPLAQDVFYNIYLFIYLLRIIWPWIGIGKDVIYDLDNINYIFSWIFFFFLD